MTELEEIQLELKELLPEGMMPIESEVDGKTSVHLTLGGVPFKAFSIDLDKNKALVTCYEILVWSIKEHREDPEGKRALFRMEFQIQWMKNIQNGVGDKNGETIPSIKQVMDNL